MAKVKLDTNKITDWASFHLVCKEAFGFPDYYGENMNAWIDCMSDAVIDETILYIEVANTEKFNARLPEVFIALIECTAFVNNRFPKSDNTKIALIFF
jgi:RNAse (barnase) inhibitor barstar